MISPIHASSLSKTAFQWLLTLSFQLLHQTVKFVYPGSHTGKAWDPAFPSASLSVNLETTSRRVRVQDQCLGEGCWSHSSVQSVQYGLHIQLGQWDLMGVGEPLLELFLLLSQNM